MSEISDQSTTPRQPLCGYMGGPTITIGRTKKSVVLAAITSTARRPSTSPTQTTGTITSGE